MELQKIIAKIDSLKEEIDELRPISPDQERRIMQKFRLEWNYHSNAIEGNKLTFGETKAFLLHGVTAKGKPFKDYLDIKGHNNAINYLSDLVHQDVVLTESDIRGLHEILLVEPYKSSAKTAEGTHVNRLIKIGEYKSVPNHVQTQTGEIHYYASPEETPAMMGDLMQWYRTELAKEELHPVAFAATFHYRFVSIHPFDDGNGRMARLLMNLILMQKRYVPVVIRLEEREQYYLALEKADSGELDDFVEMVGEELIHSMEIYLKGARGESIDDPDDFDKKVELLRRRLDTFKKVAKDNDTLNILFQSFFIPFFHKLTTKLTQLDDFFSTTTIQLAYSDKPGTTRNKDLHSFEEVLPFLKNLLLGEQKINVFRTTFQWGDFIADTHLQLQLSVSVKLRKYEIELGYKIAGIIKEIILFRSDYEESFTNSQIDAFVSEITNNLLQRIEPET